MPDGGVGVSPEIPIDPHANATQAVSAAKRANAESRYRISRRIVRLAAEFGRRDVLSLLGGSGEDPHQVRDSVDVRL